MEGIEKEIRAIQSALNKGWSADVQSQLDCLQKLCIFKARVNELLVYAKDEQVRLIDKFLSEYFDVIPEMKQYEYKDRLNVYCKNINAQIFHLERLSAVIETQVEALRTVISFNKEELKSIA